jgi:hypothetical protein
MKSSGDVVYKSAHSHFTSCSNNKHQNWWYVISSTCHFTICHFISLPFHYLAILLICHFINLPFHQLVISPTCHFINMPFHKIAISSTCHSIDLPLHQLVISSTCHLPPYHCSIFYFINLFWILNYLNLPFCHLCISSTCDFINLWFF